MRIGIERSRASAVGCGNWEAATSSGAMRSSNWVTFAAVVAMRVLGACPSRVFPRKYIASRRASLSEKPGRVADRPRHCYAGGASVVGFGPCREATSPWQRREACGSGSGSSAWDGSGRPATSRRWRGWGIASASRPSTTRWRVARPIEASQVGCAASDGLAALIDRPRRRRDLSPDAAMVRPAPRRARRRRGQADLLRPPLTGRARRRSGDLADGDPPRRRAVHARAGPAVLPGDLAAPRAAGHDPGQAPADPRPQPALRRSTATASRARPPSSPRPP